MSTPHDELAQMLAGRTGSNQWWIDKRNPQLVRAEYRGGGGGGLVIEHLPQRADPWRLSSITGETPVSYYTSAINALRNADHVLATT